MKHKYQSACSITQYLKNQYGYAVFMEAVHVPTTDSTWKWNIPYYCYLYTEDHKAVFLVTVKEVRDTLQSHEDLSWSDVLEYYEEDSLEDMEKGNIADAYFYETFLMMKSLLK